MQIGKCETTGEGATLDDLTLVYGDVAPVLHCWARLMLAAHLIKLQRERQARENGGLWRPSVS